MQRFLDAWQIIRARPLPWVAATGTVTVITALTWGLGSLLLPSLLRECGRAVESGDAPSTAAVFDLQAIGEDAFTMLLWLVAVTLGAAIGVVFLLAPLIVLWWMPMLAAERRFEGMDAAKASYAHTKRAFGDTALFVLMATAANLLGMITCVGWLLTGPVTLLAALTYFREQRSEILAAARAEGVTA